MQLRAISVAERALCVRSCKHMVISWRIEAQSPQCGKLAKSDYIIFNSSIDLAKLESRVIGVVQKILGKDR